MCGIAGSLTRQAPSSDDQAKVLQKIQHRGPDEMGQWNHQFQNWNIWFGHQRLSIIDLEKGQQPMGEGNSCLTYNGEVYNFRELINSQDLTGLQTQSDTEVVFQLLRSKGTQGLRDLNGMFALGFWDHDKQQLLLARDRVGVKPIYYYHDSSGDLYFSSELSSLLCFQSIPRQLNHQGLSGYFFSDYYHWDDSAIEGVKKLPPAHYLTWQDGKVEVQAYWKAETTPAEPTLSEDQAMEELMALLQQSTKRQLVSDVPLGVFLSGGLDSSLVATLAAQQSGDTLKTFSIGFTDPQFDESEYARLVADKIQSHHHMEVLKDVRVIEVCDSALDALDEPLGDPSILPTYLLSRMTSQKVKVALGGDGGDELLGGYPTYKAFHYNKIYQKFPSFVRDHMVKGIAQSLKAGEGYQSLDWKLKRFSLRWDEDDLRRHLRWMSNTDLPALERLIKTGALPRALQCLGESRDQDRLNQIMALDFQTYLPGSVLTKVDRASMAHSLEVRPVFLDNDLIDWSLKLPSHFKAKWNGVNCTTKYLLKRVAEQMLPEEVVHRPKKGFAIPLTKWIKGPFQEKIKAGLSDSPLWSENSPLERTILEQWNSEHLDGIEDHSKPLWSFLVLDHWMKKENIYV